LRDPLGIAVLYNDNDDCIGYRVKFLPNIKNHIFIDDIDECIWFKKDDGSISVYPYEGFAYIQWWPRKRGRLQQ